MKTPIRPVIIVHYGEIVLKGDNRSFFENRLVQNVRHALKEYAITVKRQYGRMIIMPDTPNAFDDTEGIFTALRAVYGIHYFFIGYEIDGGYQVIEETVLTLLESYTKPYDSFAVRARRSFKSFPYTSTEVNVKIGSAIVQKYHKTVDLERPDLEVFIRITENGVFISFERSNGIGGFPYGVSGPVVSLLSSGIDSPVSTYRLMRRGAHIIPVHFHSYPLTSRASIENVQDILHVLYRYQPSTSLILLPLAEMQKKITTDAPSELRVVLYRRAMIQIAERIAMENGAKGLVTGESLGQVASQTVDNMYTTSYGVSMPIYRPLIGMDKQEIVDEAKKIGTFDISIRPYEDCCSLLLPKRVATHATIQEVQAVEAALPWQEMIEHVVAQKEIVKM